MTFFCPLGFCFPFRQWQTWIIEFDSNDNQFSIDEFFFEFPMYFLLTQRVSVFHTETLPKTTKMPQATWRMLPSVDNESVLIENLKVENCQISMTNMMNVNFVKLHHVVLKFNSYYLFRRVIFCTFQKYSRFNANESHFIHGFQSSFSDESMYFFFNALHKFSFEFKKHFLTTYSSKNHGLMLPPFTVVKY